MPEEPVAPALAEWDQEQKFQQALDAAPAPVLTIALIAANVVVFILMVINGVSFMDPAADSLLPWGADFGPLTTHGQWWRLLTAAFVHIGVIHLAMNMYILLSIGVFTERLFGRVGFLVLYLLAGIGGNLASLAWQPSIVAAGASGAVFGLYGGLFGYLLRQRHEIPAERVTALAKNAGIFLAYNVVYGMAKSEVDMAAHIGGFVTGFLVACALAASLVHLDAAMRLRKAWITAAAGLILVVVAASRIPVMDDFRAEIKKFIPLESSSLKLFNESLNDLKTKRVTVAQFTESVDKKLLPPWNAERDHLAKLRLPEKQAGFTKLLVEYMTLRGDGWTLMKKGVATDDLAVVESANQKQAQADAVVRQMNTWKP